MGVKGMLETCSRCEKTIFLKYIFRGEANIGYGNWDQYEKLPDDWLSQAGVGTLCPTCAKEFRRVMTNFYGQDKVPKAWKEVPLLF